MHKIEAPNFYFYFLLLFLQTKYSMLWTIWPHMCTLTTPQGFCVMILPFFKTNSAHDAQHEGLSTRLMQAETTDRERERHVCRVKKFITRFYAATGVLLAAAPVFFFGGSTSACLKSSSSTSLRVGCAWTLNFKSWMVWFVATALDAS